MMTKKLKVISAGLVSGVVLAALYFANQSNDALKYSAGECLYNMAENRFLRITQADIARQTYLAVQLQQLESLGERKMAVSLLHSDRFSKVSCPR